MGNRTSTKARATRTSPIVEQGGAETDWVEATSATLSTQPTEYTVDASTTNTTLVTPDVVTQGQEVTVVESDNTITDVVLGAVSGGVGTSQSYTPTFTNFTNNVVGGLSDDITNTHAAYTTTEPDGTQYIVFDLGSSKTLSKVDVWSKSSSERIKGVKLEFSTDNVTYSNAINQDMANADGVNTFVVPFTTARYVKLTAMTSWNIGDANAGLAEVDIYDGAPYSASMTPTTTTAPTKAFKKDDTKLSVCLESTPARIVNELNSYKTIHSTTATDGSNIVSTDVLTTGERIVVDGVDALGGTVNDGGTALLDFVLHSGTGAVAYNINTGYIDTTTSPTAYVHSDVSHDTTGDFQYECTGITGNFGIYSTINVLSYEVSGGTIYRNGVNQSKSVSLGAINGVRLNGTTLSFYADGVFQDSITVEAYTDWSIYVGTGQTGYIYHKEVDLTYKVATDSWNGSGLYTLTLPNHGLSTTPTEAYTKGGVDLTLEYANPDFEVATYDGTGAAQTINLGVINTGVDFVWIKNRVTTNDHVLFDSIRGATKDLRTNLTSAEGTQALSLTAFGTDSFSLGSYSDSNGNGNKIVAWCASLPTDTASNTNGTITSVTKNNDFMSIISYTGNGAAGATAGHGLSSTPNLVIYKNRDATHSGGADWIATTLGFGVNGYMYLNLTNALGAYTYSHTSTTIATQEVGMNTNTATYIAYAFRSVAGKCKIGSYTGTGATGNAITGVGFEPAWVMIKRTDSTGGWLIHDNARGVGNPASVLYANTSGTEQPYTNQVVESFDADGFTVGVTDAEINASGGTYIYMAIAKNVKLTPTTTGLTGVTNSGDLLAIGDTIELGGM